MRERPVTTWLEVDLELEELVGRLHDGERPPQAFSGWLELVSVLEEARGRRMAGSGGSTPSADPTTTRRPG